MWLLVRLLTVPSTRILAVIVMLYWNPDGLIFQPDGWAYAHTPASRRNSTII
jgi:hypothetical protein